MKEVMNLQMMIFLLVAVGVLLRKLNLVGKAGQKNMNDLVIYVVLPCNILKAFTQGQEGMEVQAYFSVFFIAIGIQIFSVIYGKIIYRNQPDGKQKCLRYATICSNAGFLGNPIAEGLYGAEGLLMASIYLIPVRIMMWSFGLPVFSGETDKKQTIKKVVTHPCILACVLGIVLMVLQVELPEALAGTIAALGNCNTALSMMVIGMILSEINPKDFWDWGVLRYSIHRLLIIPLVTYITLRLLHVSGSTLGICVILAAMPAGATTSILAEKYDMESAFATKLVIFSTILSLPSIAVWSMILMG